MRASTLAAAARLVVGSALLCLAGTAQAVTITEVAAPNLTRPADGAVYAFTITITGTYSAFDIALAAPQLYDVQYWDDELDDDPIDTMQTDNLVVPAAPGTAVAGVTTWSATSTFKVGCDLNSIVIGPDGTTGEEPMDDGYFYFPELGGFFGGVSFGYNTVTCWGGSSPLETAPEDLMPVPEPSTALLAGLGLVALAASRRRAS